MPPYTAALEGLFPVNGLIAIAPYIANISQNQTSHLVIRTTEPCALIFCWVRTMKIARPDALEMHRMMSKAGMRCGLEVFPGLGHDFPQDFDRVLQRAIDFVLVIEEVNNGEKDPFDIKKSSFIR